MAFLVCIIYRSKTLVIKNEKVPPPRTTNYIKRINCRWQDCIQGITFYSHRLRKKRNIFILEAEDTYIDHHKFAMLRSTFTKHIPLNNVSSSFEHTRTLALCTFTFCPLPFHPLPFTEGNVERMHLPTTPGAPLQLLPPSITGGCICWSEYWITSYRGSRLNPRELL